MVISLVARWWLPLPLIVLGSGLATALCGERWWHFALASGVGTFNGVCSGYVIWHPADRVETAYSGLLIIVATLAAFILSLVANSAMRKSTLSNLKLRHAVWIGVGCCFSVGPIALAVAPPLVAYRVAGNDRAAAKRLQALNDAAKQLLSETGDSEQICNGKALQRHYSGPMFSEDDWRYITGNYVNRDGYVFAVYCKEKGGYVVEAWPARGAVDGTHRLCADEAHPIGCDIGSNGVRRVCEPCMK